MKEKQEIYYSLIQKMSTREKYIKSRITSHFVDKEMDRKSGEEHKIIPNNVRFYSNDSIGVPPTQDVIISFDEIHNGCCYQYELNMEGEEYIWDIIQRLETFVESINELK